MKLIVATAESLLHCPWSAGHSENCSPSWARMSLQSLECCHTSFGDFNFVREEKDEVSWPYLPYVTNLRQILWDCVGV